MTPSNSLMKSLIEATSDFHEEEVGPRRPALVWVIARQSRDFQMCAVVMSPHSMRRLL